MKRCELSVYDNGSSKGLVEAEDLYPPQKSFTQPGCEAFFSTNNCSKNQVNEILAT